MTKNRRIIEKMQRYLDIDSRNFANALRLGFT